MMSNTTWLRVAGMCGALISAAYLTLTGQPEVAAGILFSALTTTPLKRSDK